MPYKTSLYLQKNRLPSYETNCIEDWEEKVDAIVKERKPIVDIYEAIAYTAPGIVAHESALKGGEWLKIPSFDL